MGLLVLSRHIDEEIAIGDDIRVILVGINGENGRARIGIEAPIDIPVNRLEVHEAILRRHKVDRLDRLPLAKQPRAAGAAPTEIVLDEATKMARNILATTVEHSGTHAMRAVCHELLRMKGVA